MRVTLGNPLQLSGQEDRQTTHPSPLSAAPPANGLLRRSPRWPLPGRIPFILTLVLGGLLLATSPLAAQGRSDYFNVESPQVHPIEVARVNGHDYVLAVNTPDNSVEIWDTDETLSPANRFLTRVRVGLEPVSVRWVPEMERFYVANFLGDSITAVTLTATGGPATLSARVLRTVEVTDEPLDLAFAQVPFEGGDSVPTLFVTHMTLDAFGAYDAQTLAPVSASSERMDAAVGAGADIDFDGLVDDLALKEPWTPAVACDRLFLLGHKGGNTVRYDFDLYSEDLGGGSPLRLSGLGSTNWNLTFTPGGDLYVVGAEALNASKIGETQVSQAATGFVQSTFYLVENPCTDAPTVHRRDLNLVPILVQNPGVVAASSTVGPVSSYGLSSNGGEAMIAQPSTGPVAKSEALAQPTSVVAFQGKAFFTAMSSDRLGILEPDPTVNPVQWPRRTLDIPTVGAAAAMAGPRGLALKEANASSPDDPGARLYVLNRLDQSVTVVDPVAETVVSSFALRGDPTPSWVHAGRRFLYSAELSGNGFVSCSSCHTDARTDGLAWDLSDGVDQPIPPELLPSPSFANGTFPGDKGFMVTQSLQGLLNFEVPRDIQHLYTNAPYHWRGDRQDFLAFNPAFVSLMGADSELTTAEMDAYEEFINSVHYPPNPKQSDTRILSGDLGDPDDDDVSQPVSGSGALRGLKLFHIRASDGEGACRHCHDLPEGSNNVLTEDLAGTDPHPVDNPPPGDSQPIETAALRGLFQKEARLDVDGTSRPSDSPITGYEGLLHTGLLVTVPPLLPNDFNATATINGFDHFFFSGRFCQGALPLFCDNLQSVNQFVHELDFGTAPLVGESYTVIPSDASSAATARAFATAEAQAGLANAGLVVQAWIGGGKRGFWYDLTVHTPVYREEPSGTTLTRNQLLALLSGARDRLVLISTPLGSERRLADPAGAPILLAGPAPSDLDLLPMVPNTAYAPIPSLSLFWDNGNAMHGGTHAHTVRLYQNALLVDGPPDGFGLCSIRHEAPRRFRVAARDLRHGATLRFFIQNDPGGSPPNPALSVDDVQQVPTLELILPLHPTDLRLDDGRLVWETASELEPLLFYRLMSGPPVAPGLQGIIDAVTDLDFLFQITPEAQPAGSFNPAAWNLHWVRVVNTDGTRTDGNPFNGSPGWQPLRIEPGPDCP